MRSWTTLTLALPFLGGVDAFWRMNCATVQTGRIDPLVNPGAVAGHAHTIVGGSNIGVNATHQSLLNSACSSCEIQADKSAYWTPLLYYHYPNGSFYEVPHGGSVVYYLGRSANNGKIVPFPKGMKILSGNKAARSYDSKTMTWGNATYPGRPVADRISFACLTAGPEPPNQPYMYNVTQCVNNMRAQIAFQACWNGVDLYKPDNSHVAYLSSIDNGVCPPGYPHQMPGLFVETSYAVSQVPNATDDHRFVFSHGDPTGYGFHGDFQNGWEMDVLTEAVDKCLIPDNFGQISYCPSLQASDTNGYHENCPEQPPQIAEKVHGLLDKLPGCINVTYGPEAAPAASMQCAPGVPQPSIVTTVDSTPLPTAQPGAYGQSFGISVSQKYLGCFNDSAGGLRTLNALSYTNYTAMNVEFCQTYCMKRGYRLSGVEFAQECHCDNYINPTAVNGSNQCTFACGGTITAGGTQELCGGLGVINVYNNTDPNFSAFGDNSQTAGHAQPYTPPGGFPANYLGCFSDNVNNTGRTLIGAELSQQNMTVEACAAFCSQSPGYQYYGLEFGNQCFCGNGFSNNGVLLTPTSKPNNYTCNMRCPYAEPEICGGPNALSMYKNVGYRAPAQKAAIGKYVAKGCLTDPGRNGRALQGASYSDNVGMTEESCVKFCLGKKMNYAGIEYSQECYCGNSISAASGASKVTCNPATLMTCKGNKFEWCGGPSLLTLFYSGST